MKYLYVGLGNVGAEYENTRHNIGFNIVDALAQKHEASFSLDRHAYHAEFKIKGRVIHLLKPTTYMNLSGKAYKYWLDKLSIPIEQSLIIVDELAIDFGKIRIRQNGSAGGHNGLKHIEETLGNSNYPRLRFGIGNQYEKGRQVDYVLGKWNSEETTHLAERVVLCTKALEEFPFIGLSGIMNTYNGK